MSTRRTHNKTRLGCHQCKRRRVKCDGKYPACVNCDRRQIECSYRLIAPSTRLSAAATCPQTSSVRSQYLSTLTQPMFASNIAKHPQSELLSEQGILSAQPCSSPSPGPHSTPQPDIYFSDLSSRQLSRVPRHIRWNDEWERARAILAPKLHGMLYHYSENTSQTLATDHPAKVAWQHFVPRLTSQNQYLTHALLSIASLHLQHLHNTEKEKKNMMVLAAASMDVALAHYNQQLQTINEGNAAALFISATLTAVYFVRTSTLDMKEICDSVLTGAAGLNSVAINKLIDMVLTAIVGLRGTVTVLNLGHNWLIGTTELEPIFTRTWWPVHPIPASNRAADEDRRLHNLEHLWKHADLNDVAHLEVLDEALSSLRRAYALVSHLTISGDNSSPNAFPYAVDNTTVGYLMDRGAIFGWVAHISTAFMDLIKRKDRDALVLLAHFAVLLGRIRNVWWLEGTGASIIITAAMGLGRKHWHLYKWPIETAGVDIRILLRNNCGLYTSLEEVDMGSVEVA